MKTKTKTGTIPIIIMGLILVLPNSCQKDEEPADKITDKDGNVYTSVTIGTQVWMVENLKTTRYNILQVPYGESIPLVTDNDAWGSHSTPGYCWYNNNAANKTPYGALYNWYAVESGNLCPTGWHVPTYSEWITLITHLGGESVAGGKLKEMGFIHWMNPNEGATNETGFTALGSGIRNSLAVFEGFGNWGFFWSASQHDNEVMGVDYAWHFQLISNSTSGIMDDYSYKTRGLSVRCLKD